MRKDPEVQRQETVQRASEQKAYLRLEYLKKK